MAASPSLTQRVHSAAASITQLDVTLEARAELEIPVPASHPAVFTPIAGDAQVGRESLGLDALGSLILQTQPEATTHRLVAGTSGAQVAIFIGAPLGQPSFSNGPMAFATREALAAAASACQRGELGTL